MDNGDSSPSFRQLSTFLLFTWWGHHWRQRRRWQKGRGGGHGLMDDGVGWDSDRVAIQLQHDGPKNLCQQLLELCFVHHLQVVSFRHLECFVHHSIHLSHDCLEIHVYMIILECPNVSYFLSAVCPVLQIAWKALQRTWSTAPKGGRLAESAILSSAIRRYSFDVLSLCSFGTSLHIESSSYSTNSEMYVVCQWCRPTTTHQESETGQTAQVYLSYTRTLSNSNLFDSSLLIPLPSKVFSVWATITGCCCSLKVMLPRNFLNSWKKTSWETGWSRSWLARSSCNAGSTTFSMTYIQQSTLSYSAYVQTLQNTTVPSQFPHPKSME